MGDRFHVGTFVVGAALTLVGVGLAGIGFEWWEIDQIDFRYVTPALFILVGVVIVSGALRGSGRPLG